MEIEEIKKCVEKGIEMRDKGPQIYIIDYPNFIVPSPVRYGTNFLLEITWKELSNGTQKKRHICKTT